MSHFEARPRASYDKRSPAWAAGATLALAMHWVAEVLAAMIPAMAATAQLGLAGLEPAFADGGRSGPGEP